MKKMEFLIMATAFLICGTVASNASMTIDSLTGPVTQNEIDSFKTYMATQTPPPTPWGTLNGTGHNAWCDGAGGSGLEAFGMMIKRRRNKIRCCNASSASRFFSLKLSLV
jgi:hypothetical protein